MSAAQPSPALPSDHDSVMGPPPTPAHPHRHPSTLSASAPASAPAPGPSSHHFVTPVPRITKQELIPAWKQSEGYAKLFGFVNYLNEAVKGTAVSDPFPVSETCEKLLSVLSTLDTWVDEIPPIQQPMRFGNKAFRTWMDKLEANAIALSESVLPVPLRSASVEIASYLTGAFGNKTRIDYGTGHETSFMAFLCCLAVLGVLQEDDRKAVVLRVFNRYLVLMRKIQRTYMLEPAGSHGVWGLDDHQFLPYIWGSSQLIDHPDIAPKSFPDKEVARQHADEYLFLSCIQYIHTIKSGPFHEHSPMLYDISGVSTWAKVNTGLMKMYKTEVLEKFPVIQHFLFGSIIPFKP